MEDNVVNNIARSVVTGLTPYSIFARKIWHCLDLDMELLVGGDNLLSNHGNQHLDITYQPCNHGYFVVACLQRYPLPL